MKRHTGVKRTAIAGIVCLLILWSVGLGWGMAQATANPSLEMAHAKSVDTVPEKYQLGQQLYREKCGSCHLAIPPAVLPTQTWKELLENPQDHYGTQLRPVIGPSLLLMWDYLKTFSRPFYEDEDIPYRIEDSRFFEALHPQVPFTQPISPKTCITCHQGAEAFNYRSWELPGEEAQ